MQFYLHPAQGFPGVSPAMDASAVVANTAKPAVASSAIVPEFALKPVATHSGPTKLAAGKAKQNGRSTPLTLYVEGSAGNTVQLVYEPGTGWKYVSDARAAQRKADSPLVQTALQSSRAPFADARGDAEQPLMGIHRRPNRFCLRLGSRQGLAIRRSYQQQEPVDRNGIMARYGNHGAAGVMPLRHREPGTGEAGDGCEPGEHRPDKANEL